MARLRNLGAAIVAVLLISCASLPPQTGRTPTYAQQNTETTRLGERYAPDEQAHPSESAFHLLPDGIDALLARVVLTEMADKTLDLEYYIWHRDLTGRALGAAVLRAADRGVRVRLLIDDLGTNADDQVLLAISAHPNIEIRLFNPVASRRFKTIASALEFSRVDRRMHNKALIADNEAAILGGRNIGDEYFGASRAVAFGDLDVLMHGPIVRDISNSFDTFWNSDAAYPIERLMGHPGNSTMLATYRAELEQYVSSREDSPYVVLARQRLAELVQAGKVEYSWGKGTLLYDDPSKIARLPEDPQGHLMTKLRALKLHPEHEMLIVSPYFVPGDAGIVWLRGLTESGVRHGVDQLACRDGRRRGPCRISALPQGSPRRGRPSLRIEAGCFGQQRIAQKAILWFVKGIAAREDLRVRPSTHFHRLDESRSALKSPQHGDRRAVRQRSDRRTGARRRRASTRPDRMAARPARRAKRQQPDRLDRHRGGRDGHRIGHRTGRLLYATCRRLVPGAAAD